MDFEKNFKMVKLKCVFLIYYKKLKSLRPKTPRLPGIKLSNAARQLSQTNTNRLLYADVRFLLIGLFVLFALKGTASRHFLIASANDVVHSNGLLYRK